MTQPEVVVLSGVRTAIGDYGGGLKDKPPGPHTQPLMWQRFASDCLGGSDHLSR